MEKWEEKVVAAVRLEDDRKLGIMLDEISVQRHAWRNG
jgi:hypothetical protein